MTKEDVILTRLQTNMDHAFAQITEMKNDFDKRFTKVEDTLEFLKEKDGANEKAFIMIRNDIKEAKNEIAQGNKNLANLAKAAMIVIPMVWQIIKMLINYFTGQPIISLF